MSRGQFLISKIDARKGAAGVVPDHLDGAVVSADFRPYDIIGANVRYLYHLVGLPTFWRLCDSISDGSTNRVRLDLSRFDDLVFPMPPLREQHAIAAVLDAIDDAIDSMEAAIAAAENLRRTVLDELLTRGVANRHTMWREVPRVGLIPACWGVSALGDLLVKIEAGDAPQRLNRAATANEWGVLRVGSVTWGEYRAVENKALAAGVNPNPRLEVHVGDLLLSRANTPNLVGRTVLVSSTPPRLLLSDKILRLIPDPQKADRGFLHLALGSSASRAQLSGAASGSSKSMFNISQDNIRRVLLPLPSTDEQAQITTMAESLRARVEVEGAALMNLRRFRTAVADALLTGRLRTARPQDAALLVR